MAMNEDKLIELLTEIRVSCAETRTKVNTIQEMLDKHDERIGKLESNSGNCNGMKQDIIMFCIKIVGWLVLIIASLTGAAPLLNALGAK